MAIYSGMGQIMGTALLTRTQNFTAHQSDEPSPSISPDNDSSTSIHTTESQLSGNTSSHQNDESNEAASPEMPESNQNASLKKTQTTIDNSTLLQSIDFDEFLIEMDSNNRANQLENAESHDEGFQSRSPIELSEKAIENITINVESQLLDSVVPQNKAPHNNARPKWTEIERHSTKQENEDYINAYYFFGHLFH